MGIILRIGNNNSGNSAVTEIETASVTHQITIQSATATTASAFSEMSALGKQINIKNMIGPENKPILLLRFMLVGFASF
jgi:hypothetical protein